MARKRKKKVWKKVLTIAVLLTAGGAAFVYYYPKTTETAETQNSYKEETVKYGSVISGITESGSVTIGSNEQTFSLEALVSVSESSSSGSSSGGSQSAQGTDQMGGMSSSSMGGMSGMSSSSTGGSSSSSTSSASVSAGLDVEELYVAAGQVVEQGDPILKLTQESIEEYRSELESAVKSAELSVTQEEINVESKRAEADYTYEMYLAKGKTAKETYDATITSLENDVTDLEEELQESADAIAEYESELEAGEDVEEELEEEQLNYSSIEAKLQIAKNTLTTQSIEAKQTYEKAMTNYQYADQLYAIDTDGLEDDLDDAKEVLEDTQEALDNFNAQIGDGIVYAEYSGTVSEVLCSVGDTLTDSTSLLTYAASDDVTMTVSVAQDDISQISVGDEASVELTAYKEETFPATVTSIAAATSMGFSTVNYNVTVQFTGDISKVYSGMTGEATFVVQSASDTLYISNKAVHMDGAKSYVKVKNADGSITETEIETGFSNGSKVAVLSGLEEGQIVLIESQVTQ